MDPVELKVGALEKATNNGLEELKSVIIGQIKEELNFENALRVLKSVTEQYLSDTSDDLLGEFREYLRTYICKNAEYFLKKEKFAGMHSEDFFAILERDDLKVSNEKVVYDAAARWAVRAYENKEKNGQPNKRDNMTSFFEIISKIRRFSSLKPTEMGSIFLKYYNLTVQDLTDFVEFLARPTAAVNVSPTHTFVRAIDTPEIETHQSPPAPSSPLSVLETLKQDESSLSSMVSRSGEPEEMTNTSSTASVEVKSRPPSRKRKSSLSISPSTTKKVTFASDALSVLEENESDQGGHIMLSKNKSECCFDNVVRRLEMQTKNNIKVDAIRLEDFRLKHLFKPVNFSPGFEGAFMDLNFDFLKPEEETGVEDKKWVERFVTFVRSFDPMMFLRFRNGSANAFDLMDIWNQGFNVDLRLNGVKFIRMNPEDEELTLTYCKDASCLLGGNGVRSLKRLSLCNTSFNLKAFTSQERNPHRGKNLQSLVFYRVWGNYSFNEIFATFRNLKKFVIWKKKLPKPYCSEESEGIQSDLTISKNVPFRFPYKTLQKLVLSYTLIKFQDPIPTTVVEELVLDRCTLDVPSCSGWVDIFLEMFPRLQKLMIANTDAEGSTMKKHPGTPYLINDVRKEAKNLRWLRVTNMHWPQKLDHACRSLGRFLVSVGLPKFGTNYLLEWNGTENRDTIDDSSDSDTDTDTDSDSESSAPKVSSSSNCSTSWKATSYENGEQESAELPEGYWTMNDALEFENFSLEDFFSSIDAFQNYFIGDEDESKYVRFPSVQFF